MAEGAANRIRARWAAGQPAIVAWLQIPSAHHAELLATFGFDGLVVDLQHSVINLQSAITMFTAIEAHGCEPLVRLLRNDAADIGKLADCGAYGFIAPMVDDAIEAHRIVEALHYPPVGKRSLGPRRPALRWGSHYRTRTEEALIAMAMIETPAGVDNLDQILRVEGLDGVFIGPSDLALALGREPAADPTDPVVVATVDNIRGRAHHAGKRVGIFCGTPAAACDRLEEGFDLVSIGTDLLMLAEAARSGLRLLRPQQTCPAGRSTETPVTRG